jgi:hypothetical protein
MIASILIVALVIAVGLFEHQRRKREAQKRREAGYELALHAYSQALRPGMSRKEVEDYLRAKSVPSLKMCCVGGRNSDLVKIGQEDATWFCREVNVYVAFQFDDGGHHGPYSTANDSNSLEAVTIFDWADGCL